MEVFIFKNRRTAEVEEIRATDSQYKSSVQWAVHFVLEFLRWKLEDVEFSGTRGEGERL